MLATTGKLARDDLIAKDIGVNEWRGGYAPPLTSLQSGLCNSMQRYPAHHKSPHPLDPWGRGARWGSRMPWLLSLALVLPSPIRDFTIDRLLTNTESILA
jgi:hypothetical protein